MHELHGRMHPIRVLQPLHGSPRSVPYKQSQLRFCDQLTNGRSIVGSGTGSIGVITGRCGLGGSTAERDDWAIGRDRRVTSNTNRWTNSRRWQGIWTHCMRRYIHCRYTYMYRYMYMYTYACMNKSRTTTPYATNGPQA